MKIRTPLMVLLALLGLLQVFSVLAADSLPVHPFKALYSGSAIVKLKPVDLSLKGNMEMSLTDAGHGRYEMKSTIASLVGTVNSQANGEFQGDAIHPLHYEQTVNAIKQSQTQLSFNWQTKTLDARDSEEQRILPLTDGVVDPLSVYLLVMRDLQEGRTPRQYTLASGVRLKTYQATVEGEETLETPVGKLRTLRINIKRDQSGSERDMVFWFAPELGYLPVQIIRQEDGKEVLRMLVQQVAGTASKGAALK